MQSKLSSPFNLRERLRNPDYRIGIVPLASVLLVAFFLFAMTSKFIFAPGLTVELTPGKNPDVAPISDSAKYVLPVFDGPVAGKTTSAVLSIKNDSMFIFDGNIYRNLSDALPPVSSARAGTRGILLVKMDRSSSIQGLFDLTKVARDAGFSAVQLAAESTQFSSR